MLSLVYLKSYLESKRLEKMSREQLLAHQKMLFQKLVAHCYQHSPYYRSIIEKNRIDLQNPDIKLFPVLDKEILTSHFDDIVTDRRLSKKLVNEFLSESESETRQLLNKYFVTKTSGTSGTASFFIQTAEEVTKGISVSYRGQVQKGESLGLRHRIAMVGFTRAHASSTMTMSFSERFLLSRLLLNYKLFDIERPLKEIVAELNQFQPKTLGGYAKILVLLADEQRAGRLKIHPRSINSGGEQLFMADRKYIEEIFGAPVHNQYGSTEHLVMGVGRSEWGGMFLCEDRLLFEIQVDETLVTNLFNFTTPLIRYKTKDVLVPKTPEPHLNFPFQFIEDQIGRADEIPVFTSSTGGSTKVHPICFDRLMPESVKSFQVINEAANSIDFKIVLKEQTPQDFIEKEISENIKTFLAQKELPQVQFKVSFVDDLLRNSRSQKTVFWSSQEGQV